MSDVFDQGSAPGQGAAQGGAAGPSAGALIRRAREEAGLHIAALAVSLKVPVRRLEALEADRLDLMPDLVFARALARSVCRHLKLDPELVLSRLPQGQLQPLSVEGPINEPFRPIAQGTGNWLAQVSRPVWIAGGVLVLAALAVYFAPEFSAAPPATEPVPAAAVPAPTPPVDAAAPPVGSAPAPAAEAVPAQGAPAAPVPGPPVAPVPVVPAVPVPVPVAPNPPATR